MTNVLWGKKSDDNKETVKPDNKTFDSARITSTGITSTGSGLRPAPPKLSANVARKPMSRDDLPRFLVMEGHISEDDVRNALKQQQETGEFFGEILAKSGVLGSQSLVSFLAKHCKIPHIGLLDYLIDKSLLSLIPEEICMKFHLLPVDKLGRNLTIAMVNPLHNAAIQAVAEICPDLRIKPILCSSEHFEIVAKKLFNPAALEDDVSKHDVVEGAETAPSQEAAVSEPIPAAAEAQPFVVPEEVLSDEDIPVAEETPAAAPVITEMPPDGDKLLESVFGALTVKQSIAEEGPAEQEKPLTTSEMSSLESMLHTYTSAMVESMHDTYELLARKISFFKGVSPEDVAKIFARGNAVEYGPAQMLFEKGEPGNTMYVILNGRVKIRDGAKQIAILQTGDIFGEMSLVSNAPRSATAVTMMQTDLLVLSFDDILHNLPSQVGAQLLVNIIITLADRLRRANKGE